MIGLDFLFHITGSWGFGTKLAFVAGSYEDLIATIVQAAISARYRINQHIGIIMGVTYFPADIEIEKSQDKKDISYGYDVAYIGMHFLL